MDNVTFSFQVISKTGEAKSNYISAIYSAKQGDFEKAKELVELGNKSFLEAHRLHGELIQKEAQGEKPELTLLLIHAEDQLNSTETIKVLVEEMIVLFERTNPERK